MRAEKLKETALGGRQRKPTSSSPNDADQEEGKQPLRVGVSENRKMIQENQHSFLQKKINEIDLNAKRKRRSMCMNFFFAIFDGVVFCVCQVSVSFHQN